MKKLFPLFSMLLLCVFLLFGMVGCGFVQNFNVSFMVNGEVYHTIQTTGSETIVIPEDPTQEGFVFDGWYWDNGVWENPFTANSLLDAPISSNMRVYAKFLSAHEHEFTDYVSDGNASYESDGTKTASCNGEGCTETNTVPDVGSKLKSHITFKTFTLEGDSVYGKVANGTTSFSMQTELETHGLVSYQVYTQTQELIPTRICSVQEGDNVFYILADIDGEEVTYTVTVRVKPVYTVNVTFENAVIDTQSVEEDGFAAMPEIVPVNIAYNIVCDYDFSQPITEAKEITIEKQVKDEMKPFMFSEIGLDACSIYGINVEYRTATELIVPNYVTSITRGSFSFALSVERITLPFVGDQIRTSSEAYQYPFGCIFSSTSFVGGIKVEQEFHYTSSSNLTTMSYYIPSTLKSVMITGGTLLRGAFYNCSSLESVVLGEGVEAVGNYAFYGCSGLTSIALGNSVKTIGEYAFDNCKKLTKVTFSNGVRSIGAYAFRNCIELTGALIIPDSVETIEKSAFNGCIGLSSLSFGSGLTSVGETAFANCSGLTGTFVVPVGITFDDGVFRACSGLTGVEISEGVSSIPTAMFRDCSGLTSVVISNSVESIDGHVFSDCSKLSSVTIGSKVTSIGAYAFAWCGKLTSITYNGDVTGWSVITKGTQWDYSTGEYNVYCTDDTIIKE